MLTFIQVTCTLGSPKKRKTSASLTSTSIFKFFELALSRKQLSFMLLEAFPPAVCLFYAFKTVLLACSRIIPSGVSWISR